MSRRARTTSCAVQGHIPGLARVDKQARPPKRSEAALQQQTRATLANLGYHSLEAGLSRTRLRLKGQVRCPCCRTPFEAEIEGTPTGWQGNTPGFPDTVYFRWNNWPAVFIPIEEKGQGTPVQPEQKILSDAGRYPLAYSIEDAVRAVLAAEEAMDAYRFPEERRRQFADFLKMNQGALW